MDILPYGWRFLAAFGSGGILLLPVAVRARPRGEASGSSSGFWLRSLAEIVAGRPRQVALIATAGVLVSMSSVSIEHYAS